MGVRSAQPSPDAWETGSRNGVRTVTGMSDMNPMNGITPVAWIEGYKSRRPMLPSEKRVTTDGTKRMLPAARADLGSRRPLLPWEHRLGNDWRSLLVAPANGE